MTKLNQFLLYDELPFWSAPFGLSLLETIQYRKGMMVVDIGSGGGFPMLEVAERLGPTCEVTGIDPSEDSLAMINEKIRLKGITNARILKAYGESLPIVDNTIDLVISNNGFNNVKDQKQSLAECYRICKKSAQLVMTVNLPHTMTEFYEALREVLQESALPETIDRMETHIAEKRKSIEYFTSLITMAGFIPESVQPDGFKYRFSEATAFFNHSFIRQAFMPSWLTFLPSEKARELLDAAQKKMDRVVQERGLIEISVPFVCISARK